MTLWLATAGRRALEPKRQPVPALAEAADLERFRADLYYLPDEPLLGFVEIPAGSFIVGSDPGIDPLAFENERWSEHSFQGRLELPTYYIARYETTVAQFHAFVEHSGFAVSADALKAHPTHPVTHVAWTDAVAYGDWITNVLKQSSDTPKELKALLDEGWRIGLPNELQWEKAARGADGRIYPWGNTLRRELANFQSTHVVSVGSIRCTECIYGIADMSGNVWEMTTSPFRPYPFEQAALDLESEALFVMRGGSYADGVNIVRAALRGGIDPGARRPFIGFRMVLTK